MALKHYKEVASKAPNSAEALNNLGFFYLLKNDHEEALKYYEASLKIDPANSEALEQKRYLSSEFAKSGDYDRPPPAPGSGRIYTVGGSYMRTRASTKRRLKYFRHS